MLKFFDWLTENFADTTSLLALITAIVLSVLYLIIRDSLLIMAFIPYLLLTGIGIFNHQRKLAELRERHTSTTTIPQAQFETITTRMGVTVDGLVRASRAINDVTTLQASSAQEQAEVIGTTNDLLDTFLALSEQISEQARGVQQTLHCARQVRALTYCHGHGTVLPHRWVPYDKSSPPLR